MHAAYAKGRQTWSIEESFGDNQKHQQAEKSAFCVNT